MKKIISQMVGGLIVAACFWMPLTVQAQNQTVNGNLTVTGTGDFEGSTLTLGTDSSTSGAGMGTLYTDGTTSTLEFDASRSANIWKWQENGSAMPLKLQMSLNLNNDNELILYNQASTPVGTITLNPLGTSTFANSLTINGASTTMPNQTLGAGTSSVLTQALANTLYLSGTSSTLVLGSGTSGTGTNAVALGFGTTASGSYSTALGYTTKAQAYGDLAVGRYNIGGGTAASWVTTDPLFEVGNGASSSSLSDALTVLKNGNVGVGTATPGSLLSVYSGAASSQSAPNPIITLTTTAGGGQETTGIDFNTYSFEGAGTANPPGARIAVTDDNYSGDMIFSNKLTGAAGNALQERMRIAATGNIGIGTTTPGSLLSVYSTATSSPSAPNPILTLTSTTGSNAGTTGIDFNTYSYEGVGTANPPGARITVVDHNFSGDMTFSNKVPGAYTNALQERMRITNAGNVGIGTTTPAAMLEVNGTAQVDGALTAASLNGLTISTTTGTLTLANGSTLATSGANSLTFTTTGTTTLTLPTSGTLLTTTGTGASLSALPTNTTLYPTLNQNTTGSAGSVALGGVTGLGSNVASALASAENGTGSLVGTTNASLTTPVLGVATATSVDGLKITTTTGTLTLANGSTLATSGAYSLTFTATGTTALTLPTSGTLLTTTGSGASLSALPTNTALYPTLNQNTTGSAGSVALGGVTGLGTNVASALASSENGTGSLVGTSNAALTSPTLTTPALGVATATSIDGLTISTTTGTLALANGSTLATSGANSVTFTTTGATALTLPTSGTLLTTTGSGSGLTGIASTQVSGLGTLAGLNSITTGNITGLGTNVASALGNTENGTGSLVGTSNAALTSPTLTTPALGVATATSIDGLTISTTTGTLALANGSTLATSGANSLTLTTTGATTLTLPTSGTVTALGNTTTGSGSIVQATSPTLVTPNLGVATATSISTTGAVSAASLTTSGNVTTGGTLTASSTVTAPTFVTTAAAGDIPMYAGN